MDGVGVQQAFDQHFHFAAADFYAKQPRFEDAGIVENQHIPGLELGCDLAEMAVDDLLTVQMQQA